MVDRVDQLEGRQPLLEATRVIDEERLHSVYHPSTTRYFPLRDTLCYERLCATRAFVLRETMCYTSSCVIRVHMSLRDHVSSRDHVSLRDVSLRYLSFYSVRNVDISRSLCLSHLVSFFYVHISDVSSSSSEHSRPFYDRYTDIHHPAISRIVYAWYPSSGGSRGTEFMPPINDS